MPNYTCPLCGKSYNHTEELIKCIEKDDAAIKAREEEASKEQMEMLKEIEQRKSNVYDLYSTLRDEIEGYNMLSDKYNKKYSTMIDTCASSLVFCGSNVSKSVKKNTNKLDIELNELINNSLNFF